MKPSDPAPTRWVMCWTGKCSPLKVSPTNGELHPVQKAFMKSDALQCGYCTPGMIMNATGLLLSNPEPTRQEVIDAMEDNLCRCGAHIRIIEAIQRQVVK